MSAAVEANLSAFPAGERARRRELAQCYGSCHQPQSDAGVDRS
jgi:hypothetical protein